MRTCNSVRASDQASFPELIGFISPSPCSAGGSDPVHLRRGSLRANPTTTDNRPCLWYHRRQPQTAAVLQKEPLQAAKRSINGCCGSSTPLLNALSRRHSCVIIRPAAFVFQSTRLSLPRPCPRRPANPRQRQFGIKAPQLRPVQGCRRQALERLQDHTQATGIFDAAEVLTGDLRHFPTQHSALDPQRSGGRPAPPRTLGLRGTLCKRRLRDRDSRS